MDIGNGRGFGMLVDLESPASAAAAATTSAGGGRGGNFRRGTMSIYSIPATEVLSRQGGDTVAFDAKLSVCQVKCNFYDGNHKHSVCIRKE